MIRTVLGLCLALLATSALAADKRYPLSNQGSLVVPVPATWKDEMRQDDKASPSTIAYRVGAAREPQVILTPILPTRANTPPPSNEVVRQHVVRALTGVRDQAAEKEIPVVEFKGKSGVGYYFDATDKAPKPGEFKTLRQGMLLVDGVIVGFTILANSRDEQVVREAMQVLQGASRAK